MSLIEPRGSLLLDCGESAGATFDLVASVEVMAAAVVLNVRDLLYEPELGDQLMEVDVGDPDELFFDAFDHAFELRYGMSIRNRRGAEPLGEIRQLILNARLDGEELVPVWTGAGLTNGQLDAFLGHESRRLRLAWAFGGDDWFVVAATVWALVGAGFTLRDLRDLIAKDALSDVHRRVFARQRREFEDWADGAPMSDYLRRELLAESLWTAQELGRKFGASRDDMRRAMTSIDYRAERDDLTGDRWWVDPNVDRPGQL